MPPSSGQTPEGVKLLWHEERAGVCELGSGNYWYKETARQSGTVRKPCLRRQKDEHQKHKAHMSLCQLLSFPPENKMHTS
jgi:hypothetical protein